MTLKSAGLALAALAALAMLGTTAMAGGQQHLVYDIVVNKSGQKVRGSAGTGSFLAGTGSYIATFPPADLSQCTYVASLTRGLRGGGNAEPAGYVTVVRSSGFASGVFLQTFGPRGVLRPRPFHLVVAC